MATGWLRGTIKEIVSADTLVVVGGVKSGIPPEKRITLSSLVGPRLARRDGSTVDEPFAWEAREFVRKKCIGQACVFKVDYVVEQIGNREFGSIFLGQENLALTIVSNGWAKVRASGTQQSPAYEELKKAEETAAEQGLGVHNKDAAAVAKSIRKLPSPDAFLPIEFVTKVGKGKPVAAVVEAVLNGAALRMLLPDSMQTFTVALCGVACNSMAKRAAPEGAPESDSAAATVVGQPEPYAREAKSFTEMRALNREVRIVVEGVADKSNAVLGTVFYPEADKPVNLAEQLVTAGLARVVEWSAKLLTTGGLKLRDCERAAKLARRCLWTGYTPPTNQAKLSDTFTGKVMEVVSADTLVVKDVATGIEKRLVLSSLRAPRMGTRDRQPDPWAMDGREFLRKKLIGKEVVVNMEYNRKIPLASAAEVALNDGQNERIISCANVELAGGSEEHKNVSEMVVARGFAAVTRHRSDEERSRVYEKLLELEELAKAAKRGVHSSKEPPPTRTNDVSIPGNAQRAKQYLPFFQRSGKMQAIVEHVMSGSRVKVHIPKEGVSIAFAPSGIKAPMRAQAASNGRPAVVGEKYADEALTYTRENCLQRDVEVEIETMDKGGTFLGNITIPGAKGPVNLGLALLKEGLARLHPSFDPSRIPTGMELKEAETAAKHARVKVWENWSPEDEAAGAEEEAGEPGSSSGGGANMRVVVTEVTDNGEFYVQSVEEPRVAWIAEQLKGVTITDGPVFQKDLAAGSLCLGKYSLDEQWYRAYIEKVSRDEPRYEVIFLDFGNREKLASERVRPMEAALAAVPAQAQACSLAYVKLPGPTTEWGAEAVQYLSQLLGGGREMSAKVVGRERGVAKDKHPRKALGCLQVVLKEEGASNSIAEEMLMAGLASLPKLRKVRDPAAKEAITAMAGFEEEARKAHRGMFQYGDPGDSDDEQDMPRPQGAWGKR